MKQEKELPTTIKQEISRVASQLRTPTSTPERALPPADTPTGFSLASYIDKPTGIDRTDQNSTATKIKQESLSPTLDTKTPQETSDIATSRSLPPGLATWYGDLKNHVNEWVQKLEPQGSPTPETVTPSTTPEPEGADEHMPGSMSALPLIDAEILRHYGPSAKRLLLFDYDGTLTDIVTDPEKAVLSPAVLISIETLAEDPKNAVWIISGRDQKFLVKQFGSSSALGLVAEHGAFIRYPRTEAWLNLTEGIDMSWKHEFNTACGKAIKRAPGSRVEMKRAAVVWHYREADPRDGVKEARKLKLRLKTALASKEQVAITQGKCVIEARLKSINKGAIVERLLAEFKNQKGTSPDFVLCIGDDATDEGKSWLFFCDLLPLTALDMFRVLKNTRSEVNPQSIFTVTVGTEQLKVTNARWYLLEPRDVIENIMMLNQADLTKDDAGEGPLMADGVTHRGSKPLPVPRSYLI